PELQGPLGFTTIDDVFTVPTTGTSVNIHASYPTDTSAGPYPLVLLAHGFQLPPSQYYGYGDHLASHGFIAVHVDFNAALFNTNHVENMRELLGGIEWLTGHPSLSVIADLQRVGTTGHSLGGKLATHAAITDPRVLAAFTLDPVDSSMNCSPEDCPDVTNLLPVNKPLGFIGETIDSSGSLQACAPAADNFETFYSAAISPAISVDVLGANHMSFIEDPSSCGLPCTFCNEAQLPNETVNLMTRSYLVAFFGRHLRGQRGYDLYLDGATAQTRYVDTGLATISSK
ncbi:MAG: chlorophyllase/cutinase-like alpha/beta fold protein, partial [Nannocystaceae bacterium]